MLGFAAMRFIRTQWKSTQSLAEELYAIFRAGMPIFPGQVTIDQPDGADVPGLVINRPPGATGPGIVINNGSDSIAFGDYQGGTYVNTGGTGGGGIDLSGLDWPGQLPGDAAGAVPVAADVAILLYGEVVAKAGSVFKVRCWAKSPLTSPPIGVLDVRAPGLAADDDIPPGYVVQVLAFPGTAGSTRTILDAVICPPVYAAEVT